MYPGSCGDAAGIMGRRVRRATDRRGATSPANRPSGPRIAHNDDMSSTEYVLVALTILIPLVIAVVVTLWTLEQARLRSRKNRKRPERRASEPAPPSE